MVRENVSIIWLKEYGKGIRFHVIVWVKEYGTGIRFHVFIWVKEYLGLH
jgi:hypothetical protein